MAGTDPIDRTETAERNAMNDWEESLRGARVVVTGGAGFVGSWLSERLLDAGAEVWIVDNLLTGSADKIEHLFGRPGFAITIADASHAIPDPGGVDMVMHLACPASPMRMNMSATSYSRFPLSAMPCSASTPKANSPYSTLNTLANERSAPNAALVAALAASIPDSCRKT
jgi:hypothetical protein